MPQTTERRRFVARTSERPGPSPVRAEMIEPRTEGTVATLRLYDAIDSWGGYWGVSAAEFVEALDSLDDSVTEIQLHINSPGGEIWQALTIMNALRQHRARVVVTVDAIAASAATVVAMAGDEIVMGLGAEMMIHDAMNVCVGNAAAMTEMVERLDRESDNIAGLYARKAGGTVEQWRAAMLAETWYSAAEAVAAGLADRIDEDAPASDEAKNRLDLSLFKYSGRAQAPAPAAQVAHRTPAPPSASGSTTTAKEAPMSRLTDAVRERLGVADENADEDTLIAALDEALAEQPTPKPDTDPTQLPEGVVAIEQDVLATLRTQAAEGAEARKQQQSDARNALVNAAVKEGRIAPAKAAAWLTRLEADPSEAETLAKLEPGLVPTSEVGHAGDGEDESTATAVRETPAYKNWEI